MKEQNIGLLFGLLMIVAVGITIVSIWIYIDNTINYDLSEEQVDEFYTQARNGTLLHNWAIVFFPSAFGIALLMAYGRNKKEGENQKVIKNEL